MQQISEVVRNVYWKGAFWNKSNIYDRAFCENSYFLNYFCLKLFLLYLKIPNLTPQNG